jgi:hypothetical protein
LIRSGGWIGCPTTAYCSPYSVAAGMYWLGAGDLLEEKAAPILSFREVAGTPVARLRSRRQIGDGPSREQQFMIMRKRRRLRSATAPIPGQASPQGSAILLCPFLCPPSTDHHIARYRSGPARLKSNKVSKPHDSESASGLFGSLNSTSPSCPARCQIAQYGQPPKPCQRMNDTPSNVPVHLFKS